MQHAPLLQLYLRRWLFLLLFLPTCLWATQISFVDSLSIAVQNAPLDTNKVVLLNDLAWELKVEQPSKARKYLQEALVLANDLDFQKGIGQAYNYRGVLEAIHNNYAAAIQDYQRALAIRQQLSDPKGIASLYNNIGNAQEDLGDYIAALDNYQKSLVIRKELRDSVRMARLHYNMSLAYDALGIYSESLDYVLRYLQFMEASEDIEGMAIAYNQIGNVKSELGRTEEALENYQQALALFITVGDTWQLSSAYLNLGNIKDDLAERLYKKGNYDKAAPLFQEALKYMSQSLAIRKNLEDEEGIGECYNNFGHIYKNIGSYNATLGLSREARKNWEKALKYLNKALVIRKDMEDKKALIETFNGIGDVKRRQQRYPEAIQFIKRYLALAQETGDTKFIQNAYEDLAKVYAAQKKFGLAYKFQRKYDELRYERLNEERIKINERRQVLFSDQQKQRQIEEQEQELRIQEAELGEAQTLRNSLIAGAVSLLAIAILLFVSYQLKNKANQKLAEKNSIIEAERQRSEALLLNILPAVTAEELKQTGKALTKHYESVSVLFTDFQGFTKIAEVLSPEELVSELDECFRAFDAITTRYGIEKIKTIGDSYMCAAGIPTPTKNHAVDIVHAALDIRAYLQRRARNRELAGKIPFKIRLGIHTGSVVAGIVGSKKFAYDIWGDTVNLAARMEEYSAVGKINISQATYEQVKDQFRCIPRGKISVKNKGAVEMYFIE